ncbi:hypothetical protein Dimus_002933 [Dionaea muscipula]
MKSLRDEIPLMIEWGVEQVIQRQYDTLLQNLYEFVSGRAIPHAKQGHHEQYGQQEQDHFDHKKDDSKHMQSNHPNVDANMDDPIHENAAAHEDDEDGPVSMQSDDASAMDQDHLQHIEQPLVQQEQHRQQQQQKHEVPESVLIHYLREAAAQSSSSPTPQQENMQSKHPREPSDIIRDVVDYIDALDNQSMATPTTHRDVIPIPGIVPGSSVRVMSSIPVISDYRPFRDKKVSCFLKSPYVPIEMWKKKRTKDLTYAQNITCNLGTTLIKCTLHHSLTNTSFN